jgi:hypothetical protein
MNKKIMAVSILIAVLFVSSIAGTAFYYNSYYNGIVNDRNSQIASLNTQIANQNSQILNLKSQLTNLSGMLTNLTTANLVTALGIVEIPYNSPHNMVPKEYNDIYIQGSVTNTGRGVAYNSGLNVLASASNGTLLVNMTVPLDNGIVFGTDTQIRNYLTSLYYYNVVNPQDYSSLGAGQVTAIDVAIFHEGVVSNWTVTPVWTNSP